MPQSIRPFPVLRALLLLLFLAPLAGCFSEQSFPMRPDHMVRPTPAQISTPTGDRLPTRQWVVALHATVQSRLPSEARAALFSDTLRDSTGKTINVYKHYGLNPDELDTLWGNLHGLEQTAQVASPPQGDNPPPWKGFVEVDVPVSNGLLLHGRLGTPEPEFEIPGSYIVITHGLFGSLEGVDMENHVQALRRAGHHVLAVELRGHGITGKRHPEASLTFGLRESTDLIVTAQWLKKEHHAQRVGLVSFSLSGFESLLTAWLDGARLSPDDAGRPILKYCLVPDAEPAFNAGMFIVSVPIGIAGTSDIAMKQYDLWEAPCKATFQHHVQERMKEFGDPPAKTAWDFVAAELRRDGWLKAYSSDQKLRADMDWYLNLHDADWVAGVSRMECVRAPILILSAANDPLATAQDVAELFSRVKNPNIGVIMLNGGGHMGFPAMSADYYYSIMTAFFNPATAPRTIGPAALEHAATQQAATPH